MKLSELNHVAILVKDVEKSCEFYAKVLRLEPMARPAFDFPGAWFRLGEKQELHIIGGRNEPVPELNRTNHFALMTDNLEPWKEHFRNIGVQFRPNPRPDGAMQLFLRDVDGHLIEIFTPPEVS